MSPARTPRRLIVAITGATGSIYGIRLLEVLRGTGVETHLVLSRWGARTLLHETPYTLEQVRRLATRSYAEGDQGAALSSGSFVTAGMVVIPCSMRTLAAIAHGQAEDLVHRAADVVLKERRRLVLCVRESPFNDIHLENMLKLSRMGAVIAPPVPAFYNRPETLADVVNHTVGRILDLFDLPVDLVERWSGLSGGRSRPPRARPRGRSAGPRPSKRGRPDGRPRSAGGSGGGRRSRG
jgi:flavin prenyltransferase